MLNNKKRYSTEGDVKNKKETVCIISECLELTDEFLSSHSQLECTQLFSGRGRKYIESPVRRP